MIFFIGGCSKTSTTEELIANAKASIVDKKNDEAVIYLKKIIQSDESNLEARYLLGSMYLDKGRWDDAEKEFSRSFDGGYNDPKLIMGLAKVYYYQSDSIGISDLYDFKLEEDSQIVVEFFQGLGLLETNQIKEALKILDNVSKSNTKTKYSQLASILVKFFGDPTLNLEGEFTGLLKKHPDFAEGWLYKSNAHHVLREYQSAADSLLKFVNLHPNAYKQRLYYASILAKTGQLNKAEKQADVLLRLFPRQPILNEIKAQVLFDKKEYRRAKEYADKSLLVSNQLVLSRIISGVSAYELNEMELAYSLLVPLDEQLTPNHPAMSLLQQIRFKLGYIDEAINALSEASTINLNSQILSASARELMNLGRSEKASQLIKQALDKEPENASLLFQRGALILDQDKIEGRRLLLEAIDKDNANRTAINLLLNSYLADAEYSLAIALVDSTEAINKVYSNYLRGVIYEASGEKAKSFQLFNAVLESAPENIGANLALGDYHLDKGDFSEALNYYSTTYKLQSEKSIAKILSLDGGKFQNNEIITLFERELSENGNNIFFHVGLARYQYSIGKIGNAFKTINDALTVFENNPPLLYHKATLLVHAKYYDEALEIVQGLLKKTPQNVVVMKKKIEILSKLKDFDNAIKAQKKLFEGTPNSFDYLIGLITLYIDNNNLAMAKEKLSSFSLNDSNRLIHARLQSKILFVEGDFEGVVEQLVPVFNHRKSADVLIELVQSLQTLNHNQQALKYILEYKASSPSVDPLIDLKLIELYRATGQIDDAISGYKKLLEKNPTNFVLLNNFSWLYFEEGELSKALKLSKRALVLKPNNANINNSIGQITFTMGNIEKGLNFLNRAVDIAPDNVKFKVNLLESYIAIKRWEDVDRVFSKISKKNISKTLLEKINRRGK